MEFANKEYFFLLLLLIPYVLWYFLYRKKNEPTIRMSDTFAYQYAPKSWRIRIINLPMLLRCITFVLIVIILARPQTHNAWDKKEVEGIDIMLVMDVSTSMLAEDLRPNRIEAAKNVAAEFINGRPNDNIGLTDDNRPYIAAQHASNRAHGHRGKRLDTGWNSCRNGFGKRGGTTEGLKGQKQSGNPAHGRFKQHGRPLANDLGTDSQKHGHPRIYHRSGYQQGGTLSGDSCWRRAVCQHTCRDRHQDAK